MSSCLQICSAVKCAGFNLMAPDACRVVIAPFIETHAWPLEYFFYLYFFRGETGFQSYYSDHWLDCKRGRVRDKLLADHGVYI